VPNIPHIPLTTPPLPPGPDPRLQVGAVSGQPGSTVLVPVTLDHSDGLDGVHLALSYDTSRLQLVSPADVLPGSLTQGFNFNVDLNANAGTVNVDATSTSADSGLGAGTVAVLEFQVKPNAPAGAGFVDLVPVQGSTATVLEGQNASGAFRFVLSPAPSTSPGSPLDGAVTVLPGAHLVNALVSASKPAGSPVSGANGAALVSALGAIGSKTVLTVSPPSSTTTPTQLTDSFFQAVGQTGGSTPGQPVVAQPPASRSSSTPSPSTWESLDPSDSAWWDTPGAG